MLKDLWREEIALDIFAAAAAGAATTVGGGDSAAKSSETWRMLECIPFTLYLSYLVTS